MSTDSVVANTSSSSAVAVGGSVTGSIDFGGDQDWYRVSLVAGRQYRFDLQGSASGLGTLADPYLRLLDASSAVLASDDDSGAGLESSITFTAVQDGIYFLSAQAFASSVGAFQLSATDLTVSSADVAGSTATSATVSVGGSVTGAIDASGDEDWYQVSLVAGRLYRFDLQGSASGLGTLADPYLRLLDGSGVEIDFNDDSGATVESSITFSAAQSGAYYLSAQGFGSSIGTFQLSATDLTGETADVSGSTATTATVSVGDSVTGTIDASGDEDWYQVSLVAGHQYRFDLRGSASGLGTLVDSYLRLLDGSGPEIVANDDSGGTLESSITFSAQQSGAYYLSAQGFASSIGTFTLSATDLGAGAGDVPASSATSSTVEVGSSVIGTIEASGDEDWYRVSLTAGHYYRFDLQGAGSNRGSLLDPSLELLNSSGVRLAANDDSGYSLDSSIAFTAAQTGTYYLSAAGYGSGTGTFTLSARDITGGMGDVPASIGTASTVAVGGTVAGVIDERGDQDIYQVSLVAGHEYRFDLRGSASGQGTLSDPYLRLLDASGMQLAFDDDSGAGLESRITYTPGQSGAYLLSAEAFASNTGTFTLSAADLTTGEGDATQDIGTGHSLSVGGSVTGTIETNDQDWYRITLVAGHPYRFDLQGYDSGVGTLSDPYLRLLDASGAEVDFDDDSGTGLESSLAYTPTNSGTYFLSAEGYAGYSIGTFTLSATDAYADVLEGTATGRSVTPGGPAVTGLIDSSGDQDWYRIALIAGHRYVFDLQGSSEQNPLADPLLRLLDGSGVEIAFDDDSGPGLDSSILFIPAESGAYYLSAQGYSSSTGVFALSAFDFDDPGDVLGSIESGSSLPIGSSITGTIDSADDQDWYRVALVSGHTYRLDVQGAASGHGSLADPFVRVLDSTGAEIWARDNSFGTLDSVLAGTTVGDGTYFIAVEASGSSTGTFTISLADLTSLRGDVPADTSTTRAVAVDIDGSLTGFISGNDGSAGSYDRDWYQVSLVAGRTYQFELLGAASGLGTLSDPYLELLASAGNVIASNDDVSILVNDSRITYTVPAGGTGAYYLSARGWGLDDIGSYMLYVTDNSYSTSPPPDVAASTDTTATAFLGGWLTGWIGSVGDEDWYRISLLAGHQYDFALQGPELLGTYYTLRDPYLRLLDISGVEIAHDDDSGAGLDSMLQFAAVESGTYYLAARSANPNAGGTFLLGAGDITVSSSDVLGGPETNFVVAVGGEVKGEIESVGDEDWYQVPLLASHTYHFDLRGLESEQGTLADPILRLIDSSGTEVGYSDNVGTADETIRYVPLTSGTYFVSAQGWSNNTGTFVLSVTEGADNVLPSTATRDAVEVGRSTTGSIDAAGDQDWYRVELLAGHQYRFELKGAASNHGTLEDPILRLLDGSGTEIDYSDYIGTWDESITYSATQSGVYFVSAQGYSSNVGTFTLNFIDVDSSDVPANTSTLSFLSSEGGTVAGAIDEIGDEDWFQVSLAAGREYRFDLLGAESGRGTIEDPILRLLDGSGAEIDYSDNIGIADESITYSATQSGAYFLSVVGWASNTGTFTLSANDLTGGDVRGDADTGSAVSIGGSVTGTIDATGDEDWYQVSLIAGHEYRFDLKGAASGHGTITDPILRLLDGSGWELDYSDNVDLADESITYSASESGTYFLSARGWLSNTGTFTLSATDVNGGVVPLIGTSGNDVLRGGQFNDELQGLGGADHLDGKGGDDRLEGGAGDDSLSGGPGNDTLIGGDGNDVFLQTTLESLGDDSLDGGAGNDRFSDWFGRNVLDGGAGEDHFSVYIADSQTTNLVTGGPGQDTYELLPGSASPSSLAYVVRDFEVGIGGDRLALDGLLQASTQGRFYSVGTSSVSDFLRLLQSGADTLVQWDRDGTSNGYTWVTQLTLKNIDSTKINSYNFLGAVDIGTKNDDYLVGGAGNDSIFGADGDDILSGGGGADLLTGGAGADLYYVDDPKDEVIETDNEPSGSDGIRQQLDLGSTIDTVISSINFTLGAYLENLTLAAGTSNLSGFGNLLNNVLTGNAGDNTLVGGAGNDTLDGGAGSDILDGGEGSDTAVFAIALAQATLTKYASGWTVQSQQDTDRLINIEYLRFVDQVVVVPTNASPSGSVTISGDATEDQTLSAANNLADADGLGAISYQWQRSSDGSTWSDIAGATASTYSLGDADVGVRFRVVANYTDGLGTIESVSSSATGAVANVNDAPVRANAIADQTAVRETPFSFTVPANTFTDADTGDTLSYTATKSDGTALPGWLAFNASTRTFSGTPGSTDTGTINIKVTATDTGGLSATDVFALAVPGDTLTLSGKVYFWNKVAARTADNIPAGHVLMDGVTAIVNDAGTMREGATAAGGTYSVASIAGTTSTVAVSGSLAVSTADKAAVTLGDALEVLKLYLGKLANPSPYKVLASDYNADNKVTLTDALGILKAVLNKAGALEPAWVFVDEEANLSGLSNTSATRPTVDAHPVATDPSLNLVAVLRGDANGSWKPASTASYEVLPDTYFTELVAQHPDTMTIGQFGL